MSSAVLHLVVGPTAAGKTTYARRLAHEIGGVRFSIDEWMASLFWMDAPEPIEAAWAQERVRRCWQRILETALAVALRGASCVIESDLASRAKRLEHIHRARSAGLSVQMHILEAPAEERWERVQRRNEASGVLRQLDFGITKEMFDFTEALWEPPTDQEIAECNGVRVAE